MAKSLRFHSLVGQDISDALDWYEQRSEKAAQRFREDVANRLRAIELHGELCPTVFPDLGHRFMRLRHFPYLVLFRKTQKAIQILGVFHSASDSRKWRQRL